MVYKMGAYYMKLKKLLENTEYKLLQGDLEVEISENIYYCRVVNSVIKYA